MWLVAVVVLVVACGVFFAGRSFSRGGAATTRLRSVAPRLLAIAVPQGQEACAAALELVSHRFDRKGAPRLPLDECTMSESCRCRYQSVAERRATIRRKGRDQRKRIRFDPDNPPRRWGPGRRRTDWLGWSGTQWYPWDLWKTGRPGVRERPPDKIAVTHEPAVGRTNPEPKDRE